MSRNRTIDVIILVLACVAGPPVSASTEATCLAPSLPVVTNQVTVSGADGQPTLHLSDPNPAAQVSGYNIYRSPVAAAPSPAWTPVGFNVVDEDAATPGIQWTDSSGGAAVSGILFYLAAAYNGPCDTEGPWRSPTLPDLDEDGVADDDDACPATPTGAPQLLPGCSASDLLARPGLLVDPVGEGIDAFVAGLGAAVPPDPVLSSLAEASLSLADVHDDLLGLTPCGAAMNYTFVVGFLQDALTGIEDYLGTLSIAPEASGGLDEWPSDEYRMWSGQHFELSLVAADAQAAADVTQQVCNGQGSSTVVDGLVYAISDDARVLQVGSQRMVLPPGAALQGAGDLAVDAPVSVTATEYDGVLVAVTVNTMPSPFPFLGDLTYDNCLQLRVLPVQPLPGDPHPQPSWDVHPLDGYTQGGAIQFAPGTRLIAQDNGCPGVIPGGAGGADLKIDYYYEIYLNYQPKSGNFVNGLNIAYALRGDSAPVHLPEMDPDTPGTLIFTKYKSSCVDKGRTLPVFDGQGQQIGQKVWWEDCSPKQAVGSVAQVPLRVFRINDFCEVGYSDEIFDIEDDDPQDWRETRVVSVTPNPSMLLGTVAFAATGDPIVNGQPDHGGAVASNQAFAVYNPWGHRHPARGTNRASGLDYPHISGTRNGGPFRYPCGVPRLITDSINLCGNNPQSFYRLPFPQGFVTNIGQGNGDPNRNGPDSHDSWQEFAVDYGAGPGSPVRAARGGTIRMFRDNFGLNCKTTVDNECVESGICQPLSLPDLESYGNYVAIEHQDGSIGWYAHLRDGSLAGLQLGQKIRRGDPVGLSGSTGSSCGPHLHFHVTAAAQSMWLADTVRLLYQAYDNMSEMVVDCMIPADDLDYTSTNLP